MLRNLILMTQIYISPQNYRFKFRDLQQSRLPYKSHIHMFQFLSVLGINKEDKPLWTALDRAFTEHCLLHTPH
jgi:hypothetical protein